MKVRYFYATVILCCTLFFASCQNSPKVEKKQPAVQTSKVEYSCPMHPEIVQDTPGTCSKCGMDLQVKDDKIKK